MNSENNLPEVNDPHNTIVENMARTIEVKTRTYPHETLPALHIAMRAFVFQFLPPQTRTEPKPIIQYADTYDTALSEVANFLNGLKRLPLVIGVDIEGASDRTPLAEWQDTVFVDLPVPDNQLKGPFTRLLQLSRLDGFTLVLDLPSIFQSWLKLNRPVSFNRHSTYLPPLLWTILRCPTIIKVFSGVKSDLDYLRITCAVEPRYFMDLPDLYTYFRSHQSLVSRSQLEATVALKAMTRNILGISPPEMTYKEMKKYRTETKITGSLLTYAASDALFTLLNAFAIFNMLKREGKPKMFYNFRGICREFAHTDAADFFHSHNLNCRGPTALIPLIPPTVAPRLMQLIMNPMSNSTGMVNPFKQANRGTDHR
jgi:3'-5' exonuclease